MVKNIINSNLYSYLTVLTLHFFTFSTTYRGSKAEMQAAASGGEVPPRDNEQILQNEMPAY